MCVPRANRCKHVLSILGSDLQGFPLPKPSHPPCCVYKESSFSPVRQVLFLLSSINSAQKPAPSISNQGQPPVAATKPPFIDYLCYSVTLSDYIPWWVFFFSFLTARFDYETGIFLDLFVDNLKATTIIAAMIAFQQPLASFAPLESNSTNEDICVFQGRECSETNMIPFSPFYTRSRSEYGITLHRSQQWNSDPRRSDTQKSRRRW